jgi:hypothetical protein
MGRQVKSLFDEGMLRSFSVGFRPIEASGMTRKEAESRPDWQEAYERTKGQIRVHRKWSLIELSVAPIPSNPDALVTSYKAKGIVVPSWLNLKSEDSMDDETPDETEVDEKAAKPCDCGDEKCAECAERMRTKDEADDDEPDEPEAKAMDADAAEATEAEEEMDDEAEEEEGGGFRRGDHVKVRSPHFKGVGVVQGVHHKGVVPHADNDLMASKDEPAARVKAYKAMGDGHTPTGFHVAVKCMHMSKMDSPMVPPTKGKRASYDTATKTAEPEPLPPLVALSESEVQQEAIKQASEAAVKRINELFGVV